MVPDRSCGNCNVCCVVPKIDEAALQKLPGCHCRNALADGACAIYAVRPETCRSFFCGWRLLYWVDARLRPDRSAVFIRLTNDKKLMVGPHPFALTVTVLNHEGLNAPGLIETIIRSIDAQIDTYLIVPGPPGYTSCRRRLNDAFGATVRCEDGFKSLLEEEYAEALAKLNETRPVVLTALA